MNDNRLRKLREDAELTKLELSEKLKVSDSIYSRWERGKEIIPTRRIYQIANFYELNIDYILGFTDKKFKIKSGPIDMGLVSKRAIQIRNDFGETLREFTKRLNTSSSTWSAYETGKTLILSAFLLEISKFGGYSIDWVLGRSDKKYIKEKVKI